MVEVRTAKDGTKFLFEWIAGRVEVFVGERQHSTIAAHPPIDENNDKHFQATIDAFMATWNMANPVTVP